MFESHLKGSFALSDTYFAVIEMLRVAADWIGESKVDLFNLEDQVQSRLGLLGDPVAQEGQKMIRNNWRIIRDQFQVYEKDLLRQMHRKRDEVKSLRDGVSNSAPFF